LADDRRGGRIEHPCQQEPPGVKKAQMPCST
jgi:hypothetical protein